MLAVPSTLSRSGSKLDYAQHAAWLHTALWWLMLARASIGAPLDDNANCATTCSKDVPVLLQSVAIRNEALRASKLISETALASEDDMGSKSTGHAVHRQPGAADPDSDFVHDPQEDAENLPHQQAVDTSGSEDVTSDGGWSDWESGGNTASSGSEGATSNGGWLDWARGGGNAASSSSEDVTSNGRWPDRANSGNTVSSGDAGVTSDGVPFEWPDWAKGGNASNGGAWEGDGDSRKYSHTTADGVTHHYHARKRRRRVFKRAMRSGWRRASAASASSSASGAFEASGMAGGGGVAGAAEASGMAGGGGAAGAAEASGMAGGARAAGAAGAAMTTYRWKFHGKMYNFAAKSQMSTECTTYQNPSQTFSAVGIAPVGTPCLFGVDERDEGKHCIMDSSKGFSSEFGWCYTTDDQVEWGLCSANCPVFGHSKAINDRLTILGIKLEALLAKIRGMPDYCHEKGCKIKGTKSTGKKKKKKNTKK